MSDSLELQLRAAFDTRLETLRPEREDRLCAFDYGSRASFVRRRLAAFSAAVTVSVAGLVAAILLLASGASVAFAGWTAIPHSASVGAISHARRVCGSVAPGHVLASEARGPYTAIVFIKDAKAAECVVKQSHVVVSLATTYPLRVYASATPEKVMLPVVTERTFGKAANQLRVLNQRYQETPNQEFKVENGLLDEIQATESGPGSVSMALGIAGHDVTGVTFVLRDGHHVRATVEHRWYVAWWPGAAKPGGAEAERVAVTTASGTRASQLPPPVRLGTYRPSKCSPGDPCSVLLPLKLTPAIAPILAEHFAMFRTTPVVKQSAEPRGVRRMFDLFSGPIREPMTMQNGRSLGLDPAQARSVKLGSDITFWFIPGSEGSCQARILHDGGDGASCGPTTSPLSYGVIDSPGTVDIHGSTKYVIGGWVPNGNRTISIRLASGQWQAVPVKHNAFVAYFNSSPVSVRFRSGFGRIVTRVAPVPNEI
jgi:hypothetical protein